MKLWELTTGNREGSGLKVAKGFVIAAPTAVEAREIAQEHGGGETVTRAGIAAFWTNPRKARCAMLARECRYKRARVVLSSYTGV